MLDKRHIRLTHFDRKSAVDGHLAGQLLLPMSLALRASRSTVTQITKHLSTNAWVIDESGVADMEFADSGETTEDRVTPHPMSCLGTDVHQPRVHVKTLNFFMVDLVPPRPASAPMSPRWEHFSHQADVGVRGLGPTRESAFEQAATALMAAICDSSLVSARDALEIQCEAPDEELLLVEWLNAVIFEMVTRRMLFRDFKVTIAGHRLRAWLRGEPIDSARHRPAVEVKGATMTELRVGRGEEGGWIAQCVIDV